MLKQILFEFEQASIPLCLDQLSQKLEVSPHALEGMLDTLVQKGRLQEISAPATACQSCLARSGCVIIKNSAKSYMRTS